MTDGIIQKVIKRYIAHMNSFNGYTNFNSIEIPSLYKQLQQELIEEIKKNIEKEMYIKPEMSNLAKTINREYERIQKILIGDN